MTSRAADAPRAGGRSHRALITCLSVAWASLVLCAPAMGEGVAEGDSLREPPDVIVYYFHQTARCDNCLKFEEYSRRAVENGFPFELRTGRVHWLAVNVDDEGNERFIEEYDVFESALVLVRVNDGVVQCWKKLDSIWSLVGEPDLFIQYVADEVGCYLSGDDRGPQPGLSAVADTLAPTAEDGGSGVEAGRPSSDHRHEESLDKE